jgi:hypothetical protein
VGGPKVGRHSDRGIRTITVASLKLGLCQSMSVSPALNSGNGYLTVRLEHSDCNKKYRERETERQRRVPWGEVEVSVKFRMRGCVFEPLFHAFIWKGREVFQEPSEIENCSLTDNHMKHQNTVVRASSLPIFNCRKDCLRLISAKLCCKYFVVAPKSGGAFLWVSLRMAILLGLFLPRAELRLRSQNKVPTN